MSSHALLEAAAALRASDEPFWIATVVGVRGSASCTPGARMLVTHERCVAGSLPAGVEIELVHKSCRITIPTIITCGAIDILLEPAHAGELDPLALIETARDRQARVVLATVIRGRVPAGWRVGLVGDGAVMGCLPDPALHARACEALRTATATQVLATCAHELLVEVLSARSELADDQRERLARTRQLVAAQRDTADDGVTATTVPST